MSRNSIAVIIPTKDRLSKFSKILNNFEKQTNTNFNLIVIDSSNKYTASLNFKNLKNSKLTSYYFYSFISSSSVQRNIGIDIIKKNNILSNWVLFLDDDIEFDSNFILKSNKIIEKLKPEIRAFGPSLNIDNNFKNKNIKIFKYLYKLFDYLDLYKIKNGQVAKSGWHTFSNSLQKENSYVQWLPSGCLFVRSKNILKFDTFYSGYGFLEDLDYTYTLSKERSNNLIKLKELQVRTPSIDRSNLFFGYKEILNRYYFVKKHSLSKRRFFFMIISRSILTLIKFFYTFKIDFFFRFIGNILYIFKELKDSSNYYFTSKKKLKILVDVSHSSHGGGTSLLKDICAYLKKDKNLYIETLVQSGTTGFEDLVDKNNVISSNFIKKIIFKHLFYYNNSKKFDLILNGGSGKILSNSIFLFQNNISVDRKIIPLYGKIEILRQYLIRYFVRKAIKKSLFTIVPSHESKRLLQNENCTVSKIKVINNFAILDYIDLNKNYSFENKNTFLYVSNYVPHKAHENLFDVFGQLSKKYQNIHLVCVGKWSIPNFKLKLQKSKYYIKNKKYITLIGEISRNEIIHLHKKCKNVIFASMCEAGSISLIEALKLNKSLLLNDMSSNREYADDAAIYFNSMKKNTIIESISKIIHDEELKKDLQKRSCKVSQKFDGKLYVNTLMKNINSFI